MTAEKAAKAEIDKEVVHLRVKVGQLEEAEKKREELELVLKAAKEEATTAVEKVKSDVDCLTLVDFKRSEEFIGLLGERYDGGWVAAKRCVCHSHPSFDWEQMETTFTKGAHLRPLDGEPYICFQDVIVNIIPVTGDEEAPSS